MFIKYLLNQPRYLREIYRPGIDTEDSSEVSVSPAADAIYKREGLLYNENSNHYYIKVYEFLPICVMML